MLFWGDLGSEIPRRAVESGRLAIVLSPFVTGEALRALWTSAGVAPGASLVVRWSKQDLATGIADLSVYEVCESLGIRLFRHESIHLKLYIFENRDAFLGSANASGAGLGTGERTNVELSAAVHLTDSDREKVQEVLADATGLSDADLEILREYQASHLKTSDPLPDLPKLSGRERTPTGSFALSELPETTDPEALLRWYAGEEEIPVAARPSYERDLRRYAVPVGMTADLCRPWLRAEFQNRRFIAELSQLLSEAGSARFGDMKQWVRNLCTDDLPRDVLEDRVRNLFEWLSCFYPEVSHGRPNYTQVLRWSRVDSPDRPSD